MNPDDLRRADAIEVVLGQGAKPGSGGMLLAEDRRTRRGNAHPAASVEQRSACRHPDWTGPDDRAIKIAELREIINWAKPIYVKVGATRTYYDVQLAVKVGADAVVVNGMQGGTAATQGVFIEPVGVPTPAAIPQAVQALQELGIHRKMQLIVSGGIRSGADPAGITTQDPYSAARLDPVEGARRVANYLRVLIMEAQTMARVPVAGTNWIPGSAGHTR